MHDRLLTLACEINITIFSVPSFLLGFLTTPPPNTLQWGTADAEIDNPSAENRQLSEDNSLKPGVGQRMLHLLQRVLRF